LQSFLVAFDEQVQIAEKSKASVVDTVSCFAVLEVTNIFFAPQSANPQRKLNSFAPHAQGPQV